MRQVTPAVTSKFYRPQPPKTHGAKTVVIAAVLIGCAIYVSLFPAKKTEPAQPSTPTPAPGAEFVEVDLRGPLYDRGRSAGYEGGLESGRKGFARPAEQVLQFQAGEKAAGSGAETADEQMDFKDGYQSGYELGWLAARPAR